MNNQPKLKPEISRTDRIINIIGGTVVLLTWGVVILSYFHLPDVIPIHFNTKGEADRFGGKIMICLLPSINTLFYVGLTVLSKFPYIFSYRTKITPQNALKEYTHASQIIRYLNLMIVLVFAFITLATIHSAN